MIKDLIIRVFKGRDAAHVRHWNTGNGEEHRALGSFYEDVIDSIDKLVEARQGAFGLVGEIAKKEVDMVAQLEADFLWISENRSEIAGNVPAIENIVDELAGKYLSTLYKLKHLR